MSILGNLFESRSLDSFGPWGIPKNSERFHSDAGESVSDRTAMQLIAVNACVGLLADSVASLPIDAYQKSGKVRKEVTPTPALVESPFYNMDTFDGWFQTVQSLALRGETLAYKMEYDKREYPYSLLPIHPDLWRVRRDMDTGLPIYSINGTDVPTAEVMHIRRYSMAGCLNGISPIEQARQGIGLGLAAERYGARYFGDSANPSSVLESEENLDDEAATANQKRWIASHGGRRYPAMLTGGLKWKAISITPNESQFLETRKFQRDEIASLYRIPPHMIGAVEKSTSWGTGIEQQGIGYVQYTLGPWLRCIEGAFTNLLPKGQFFRFNVDALLRGDQKARYDSYTQGRTASWLSVNEIRAKEDLPPVEGGDSYIQPLNFGPLGSDPLASKEPASSQGDNNA